MNLCKTCAPAVPGKRFALMVSGKTHVCPTPAKPARLATSKVVSYHASQNAAQRALLHYCKKVPGARTYILRTREPSKVKRLLTAALAVFAMIAGMHGVARADIQDDCSSAYSASAWSRAAFACAVAAAEQSAEAEQLNDEMNAQALNNEPIRSTELPLFWADRALEGADYIDAGDSEVHLGETSDGRYLIRKGCALLYAAAKAGLEENDARCAGMLSDV